MTDADLTILLSRLQGGDKNVLDELLPAVYRELRAMAGRLAPAAHEGTLHATALVNEFCVKVIARDGQQLSVRDRAHFFAVAARAMRNLLADHARKRRQLKRGGGWERVTLHAAEAAREDARRQIEHDLTRLHDSLDELERIDERAARVVELRFLAGMTQAEVADVLGVTERTVARDWRVGRAFLRRSLDEE